MRLSAQYLPEHILNYRVTNDDEGEWKALVAQFHGVMWLTSRAAWSSQRAFYLLGDELMFTERLKYARTLYTERFIGCVPTNVLQVRKKFFF